MVELVEVEDESFETKQPGPSDNEDDYYTDTGMLIPSTRLSSTNCIMQTLKSHPTMKTLYRPKKALQTDCSPCAT